MKKTGGLMMKEEYTKPEARLDEFQTVDVITTSGYGENDNEFDL